MAWLPLPDYFRDGPETLDNTNRVARGTAMTTSTFQPPTLTADVVFSALGLVAVVKIWRRLKNKISDSYRPELHYMRGPGPKWCEKHARAGRLP
jgi:hypothetical protein